MTEKQIVSFETDALLVKVAREKAAQEDMSLERVLRRLLTLWYYDIIALPEPPAPESHTMAPELWEQMQAIPALWRDDEEHELFLEWLRQERGHPPADAAARERRAKLAEMFDNPSPAAEPRPQPVPEPELALAMAEA